MTNCLQLYTAAKHLLEIVSREHTQEVVQRGFEVLRLAIEGFSKAEESCIIDIQQNGDK